ncbi:MAG TPA: hypothetical protein VFK56_20715 [Mycobacterium sp.]|nr:hypothetical protein [Mycobacterium sp.]
MSFRIRLEDNELGVRCRIETCNAYGSFLVDGEAIFFLPAPVSPEKPEIVEEFTEQVGAPAVFPYLRAAVASLAAQISVPASPLPVLRAGDVALTEDKDACVEEEVSQPFMHGTMSRTAGDGSQEEIGEFFVDRETGVISRIGGEGETPEVDQLLNAWAETPGPDELTWEWMVRQHGEASIRRSIEASRATEGDDVTDATLAEIDEAVARIEAEDAFTAIDEAMNDLSAEIAATRRTVDHRDDTANADPAALLEAAERIRDSWERVRAAMASPDAEAL